MKMKTYYANVEAYFLALSTCSSEVCKPTIIKSH